MASTQLPASNTARGAPLATTAATSKPQRHARMDITLWRAPATAHNARLVIIVPRRSSRPSHARQAPIHPAARRHRATAPRARPAPSALPQKQSIPPSYRFSAQQATTLLTPATPTAWAAPPAVSAQLRAPSHRPLVLTGLSVLASRAGALIARPATAASRRAPPQCRARLAITPLGV